MKVTSGGKYDADSKPAFFIAGVPDILAGTAHPHVLVAINELSSKARVRVFEGLLEERRVLLDSGIYNLAMNHAKAHGTTHDEALSLAPEEIDGFDRLWDSYLEIATRFADRLWGVIELDQGGVANKPRTRARIEAESGIVPMPVYHPLLDGWDYYDDLAREYDRLCFGNLVRAAPPVRLRLIWTAMQRAKEYPGLWTHLLGVTPNQNLLGSSWRGSCDSSSWRTSMRWMPSWRGFAMLSSLTPYPPDMWYGKNMSGMANDLGANTALAHQIMLDDIWEDTHPWPG